MDGKLVTVKFEEVPTGMDFWYRGAHPGVHLVKLECGVFELMQDEGPWRFGPQDDVQIEEIQPTAAVTGVCPPPADDPDFYEVFPFNVFP